MSDSIKHECGLALIRLRKPLDYYHEKYGTALYGLNKLHVLLQKQRNRGQDGAGIATIKLDPLPGNRYISRKRSNSSQYLKDLFTEVYARFNDVPKEKFDDPQWLKANRPYTGEILLGHLRYGTHGANTIETVHPFLRQNNWITRNLVMAGNFNMTNMKELFDELISFGQHPKERSDTVTIMEKIGHFLDLEVDKLFNWFKAEGYSNEEITTLIAENIDVKRVLQRATRKIDGGYVMAGIIGHGDAFVMRDPAGIRPAYYYADDEIVAVASERPALMTTFGVHYDDIKELPRGNAIIIKKNGDYTIDLCKDQLTRKACSFERIYFSRGNDKEIYQERKELGKLLADRVLAAANYDFKHTVFSFIPNTAETAYIGMAEELQHICNRMKGEQLKAAALSGKITDEAIDEILKQNPRMDKLAVKDAKMRTFIADDVSRKEMVSTVYDVTYGIIENYKDTIVVMDDSIVRGTTLRDSVIRILNRLKPKRIIVVSSAPQIRYPDCYGIDMSKMNSFVAFNALIALLEQDGKEHLIEETYQRCVQANQRPLAQITNELKPLYDLYTQEQISHKISEMLTPTDLDIEVTIIYQSIENLHKACPDNTGDWYFSGNYPTLGGNRVVNKAFINYFEKSDVRAY